MLSFSQEKTRAHLAFPRLAKADTPAAETTEVFP